MGPLEEVLERERTVTANQMVVLVTPHTLPPGVSHLLCETTAATTLILPHPREVTGKFIGIVLLVDGGDLTLKYYKGETLTTIGTAFTAALDHLLLYSNGTTYDLVVDVTT